MKQGVTLAQANEEMKALAQRISEAHGEVPVTGAAVVLMRERFAGAILYPLFSALLAVTGLVLLVACANVANLLLVRASARRKEMGICLALGASPGDVMTLILKQGMILVAIGLLVGSVIAFSVGRLLQSQLLGINASDPLTFISVVVLLVAVALLACFLPARRATKVDPMLALRYE